MKQPTSKRAIRLGSEIQKVAGDFIRRVVEPQLSNVLVTVIDTRVSDDLRHAELAISIHPHEEEIEEQAKKLVLRAASKLRKEVATKVRMKKLPEFRFFWDDTMKSADRIEQLLNHINNSQSPPTEE
ncbi:30S ribosome-binding factor RbfA [bacterium]|nr:30S ribosome-binding factor RbfA [bacterium]